MNLWLRVAFRVLARAWAFGWRGIFVSIITSIPAGVLVGGTIDALAAITRHPVGDTFYAMTSATTAFYVFISAPLGLLAYGIAGVISSRHPSFVDSFYDTFRVGVKAAVAGAWIGALCLASLAYGIQFATGQVLFSIPTTAPLAPFWTVVLGGWMVGAIAGFVLGTFAGSILGARKAMRTLDL